VWVNDFQALHFPLPPGVRFKRHQHVRLLGVNDPQQIAGAAVGHEDIYRHDTHSIGASRRRLYFLRMKAGIGPDPPQLIDNAEEGERCDDRGRRATGIECRRRAREHREAHYHELRSRKIGAAHPPHRFSGKRQESEENE
jgi:hypothetical protein